MPQHQNTKGPKQWRPRHNSDSQNHRPSPEEFDYQSIWTQNDGAGYGPGGGDTRRYNKGPHNRQQQNANHNQQQYGQRGFPTRVFTPSGGKRGGFQNLSNAFPGSASPGVGHKSEYDGNKGHPGPSYNYGVPNNFRGQPRQRRATIAVPFANAAESNEREEEEEESNRLNSAVLSRIDKGFLKLHGTASQVAVYRFNPTAKSWDETDTVGCLFLYERVDFVQYGNVACFKKVGPKYGLMVMNRKNTNNFIQCFGEDGQVVLQTPYLLLRSGEDLSGDSGDGTQAIHCIWFYDNQDCVASANILRQMGLKFEGETGTSQKLGMERRSSLNSGQLTGNVLLQILQQNKRESPTQPKKIHTPKIMTAEELESEMLRDMDTSNQEDCFKMEQGPRPIQTVQQLEQDMMMELPDNNFQTSNMTLQNELIKTLGLTKPIKPNF